MKSRRFVFLAGIGLAVLALVRSQAGRAGDLPLAPSRLFVGLLWMLVVAFCGGRVLAVTGVRSEPDVFYFGGVAGGVWKSTDDGQNWEPLTDKEPIVSVGSIALSDADPNVIYVGTGEGCPRGDITYGNGVWKSLDGGKT